jgi:hypothetical protein
MSKVTPDKTYWFQAIINRNGVMVTRQGAMSAGYAYEVKDNIVEKAKSDWKCPLVSVDIYAMDKEGELGVLLLSTKGLTDWNSSSAMTNSTTNVTRVKKPEPKAWEFGTFFAVRNYTTRNMEDI